MMMGLDASVAKLRFQNMPLKLFSAFLRIFSHVFLDIMIFQVEKDCNFHGQERPSKEI